MTLLAVPNVSEGRDAQLIGQLGHAFQTQPGVHLLDVHSDAEHHRSVFTLAGRPGGLSKAILKGARAAVAKIELANHQGVHPRVGALDVAPIVYLTSDDRGAACAEALVAADLLGHELELPVFLYGALAAGRARADLRRGGPGELARRMAAGELRPDFGPEELHPSAGAVLVAARPPLIAFNVELAPPATLDQARQIAAAIREGGPEGLPGVRAIGVWLEQRGMAQVSTNIEDATVGPLKASPLKTVLDAVARHAAPVRAELVGLAPRSALASFPETVELRSAGTIEDALAGAGHG